MAIRRVVIVGGNTGEGHCPTAMTRAPEAILARVITRPPRCAQFDEYLSVKLHKSAFFVTARRRQKTSHAEARILLQDICTPWPDRSFANVMSASLAPRLSSSTDSGIFSVGAEEKDGRCEAMRASLR